MMRMMLVSTSTGETAVNGWDAAIDVVVLLLILAGAILCLTAAIGILRFRDVPTRLHAATKPQVLGFVLICLAIALSLESWAVVAFLVPVVLVQLASAPLSAHMIARQAHRNGTLDESVLVVDELARAESGADNAATGEHRSLRDESRED